MLSSSFNLPSSTAFITRVAVKVLEIEPILNFVLISLFTLRFKSAYPMAFLYIRLPPWVTAILP